jgi:MoaA/NifB/PqqE/SkfB family radical SAM enzyme
MNWTQIARMGIAWARGALRLRYAPKEICIEPTNICNYRCSFCPQSTAEHQELPRGFMKLEHLDIILDKVVQAGAAWNKTIHFTHDGEPLLHPDFPEFVRRANQKGFRPRFASNGSKLTPEKADLLEAAGYFVPSIDFSGSREVFEKYRGKPGHWELVRDHIAYLIAMSNRNPKVRLDVREMGGWAEPAQAEKWFEQMKACLPTPTCRRVHFAIRVFHNAAGAVPHELLDIGIRTANGSSVPRAPARSPAGDASPKRSRYRQCPYPWTSMNIAWDGEVHACCRDLEGRTRLGNLLTCDSLWDIWNGARFREFRHWIATRQPEKLAACAGCDLPWSGDPRKWSLANIYRTLRDR